MGQGATPEKLKKIIDGVDKNGNNEIEWVEYLQIMRNFYPSKLAEYEKKFYEPAKQFTEFTKEDIDVFVETFRNYDLDGNGSIDARELEEAFKKMGQGASKEKVEQMIKDADDDGNGTVEWVEFLGIMRKMYSGYQPKTEVKAQTPVKNTTTSPTPVKNTTTTSTPVKSTTTTSTPVKNTTSTTPVKSTTTTSTPVKNTTTTSSTPVKNTTTTSPTPVKNTTTSTPVKGTTTTTTTPPQKSTFGGAKPSPSTGTTSVTMGTRSGNSCAACGKSVYPIEEIKAMGTVYHKGCFRCQAEGCAIQLTLNTFKGVATKVYCARHAPMDKPTQLTVSGSLALQNATNAPKLQKAQGIKKNERMTFAPGELQPLGQSKEEE